MRKGKMEFGPSIFENKKDGPFPMSPMSPHNKIRVRFGYQRWYVANREGGGSAHAVCTGVRSSATGTSFGPFLSVKLSSNQNGSGSAPNRVYIVRVGRCFRGVELDRSTSVLSSGPSSAKILLIPPNCSALRVEFQSKLGYPTARTLLQLGPFSCQ